MIETKDIKKMVKHIVRRDQGVRDPQIMHPTREWFTGLSLAVLIVCLGSLFCFYTYTSFESRRTQQVAVSETAVPYKAAVVEEAVTLFAAKKEVYNKILLQHQNAGAIKSVPVLENADTVNSEEPKTVELGTSSESDVLQAF